MRRDIGAEPRTAEPENAACRSDEVTRTRQTFLLHGRWPQPRGQQYSGRLPSTQDQLLIPIVQRGLAQVGEVVETSDGELNAVGAKIRQLANEYAGVGDGEPEGEKAPGEEDRTIQTVDFKQTPSG